MSGFKKRAAAGLLTFCACALSPARAFANSPDAGADSPSWLAHRAGSATPAEARPSTGPVMVRSLAAIALLAGLGATALFVRKRRGSGLLAPVVRNDFRINVLGSTRVGPKAHAVVASVAGRVLLLGVTDNAVQKLAWLDGGPALGDEELELEGSFDARADVRMPNAKAPTPAASRMATDEPPESTAPVTGRAKVAVVAPPAPTGTFRDLLSRFTKQEEQREKSGISSPAAILAESTEDVYDGRRGSRGRTADGAQLRAVRAVQSGERSLAPAGRAIEGQAKGLAALLQSKVV